MNNDAASQIGVLEHESRSLFYASDDENSLRLGLPSFNSPTHQVYDDRRALRERRRLTITKIHSTKEATMESSPM
ncbi:hypothetical protein MUP79_03905 [Candidatus Bathyarchaeota archaeon]|nr:hypothetical protein [Candidatus Bathyarchaeota archaeon]